MSWKNQNIYISSGKCDDQHPYKDMIEAAMVSTPGVFNDNSQMSYGKYFPIKQPSTRK